MGTLAMGGICIWTDPNNKPGLGAGAETAATANSKTQTPTVRFATTPRVDMRAHAAGRQVPGGLARALLDLRSSKTSAPITPGPVTGNKGPVHVQMRRIWTVCNV